MTDLSTVLQICCEDFVTDMQTDANVSDGYNFRRKIADKDFVTDKNKLIENHNFLLSIQVGAFFLSINQ